MLAVNGERLKAACVHETTVFRDNVVFVHAVKSSPTSESRLRTTPALCCAEIFSVAFKGEVAHMVAFVALHGGAAGVGGA